MKTFEFSLSELGVELDVSRTMASALEPGRRGDLRTRASEILAARRGQLDIPIWYSVDDRRAAVALSTIADAVRVEPSDARLDLNGHSRVSAQPGEELDVEATISAVSKAVELEQDVAWIVMRPVAPTVTTDSLSMVDITKVVATYETKFKTWGDGVGRSVNISTAAKMLDGTVVMPGQSVSFNQLVGPRTLSRGYAYAPEIVGDELQPGVGGGVCQVASTLYAAALFSSLDIQERWAHARPSSYTKLGLDATVYYGTKDLRFKNTLHYPVLLHVYLPAPGVVRAEVLGGDPVAEVAYHQGIARTQPFVRRIVRKHELAAGKMVRHQKGLRGYSVYSLVRTTYSDGRVVERGYSSEYRPTPEILWISEDFDESRLPELPDGASGVEALSSPRERPDHPFG
jgi:vancomycin resistance protein YoaR